MTSSTSIPSPSRLLSRGAALGVAAVLLAGCGGGNDPPVARASTNPCPYTVPGVTFQCGTLEVPENYDKPQARRIKLPYLVVPASGAGPKGDPVVFLTGGPGYSAIADLGAVLEARPMYARRDLVVIEQRGNGDASPGLHCGQETPAACHARLTQLGIDLSQYSTANAARDVIQLRKALGHPRWNLWGVSYGVATAFAILRADPEGVSAAVLDSGSEPSDIAVADVQSNLDGFTRLFAACAADAACNVTYPRLRDRFIEAAARLDQEPLDLAGTPLQEFFGQPRLDGAGLVLLAAQLQQTPVFARVPTVIDALARGELEGALDALVAFQTARPPAPLGFDESRSTSVGLTYSVYCGETPYSQLGSRPLQTLQSWPDAVVAALTPDYYKVCKSGAWPVARVPPEALSLVRSNVRTLFIHGALDPITPPRQAEISSALFTRKTLVTVPWETHAVVGRNACATAVAAAFLERELTDADQACLPLIAQPAFVP
jgi:pimeloyl-ACP methyl ester carboxylesterase